MNRRAAGVVSLALLGACGDKGGGAPATDDDTGSPACTDCDGDGAPADEDCDDADPAVHPGADEACADGVDQDCDGLVDCEDPDCAGRCVEGCGNGEDDDHDGLVDCADPDCSRECPEDCTNGEDDDADGLVDCDDIECVFCEEDCGNGVDDDGDGLVDCEDAACAVTCTEACDNGEDEDQDGLVDCQDDDCAWDAACLGPPATYRARVASGSAARTRHTSSGGSSACGISITVPRGTLTRTSDSATCDWSGHLAFGSRSLMHGALCSGSWGRQSTFTRVALSASCAFPLRPQDLVPGLALATWGFPLGGNPGDRATWALAQAPGMPASATFPFSGVQTTSWSWVRPSSYDVGVRVQLHGGSGWTFIGPTEP